ncbi:UNVERIFIED_CONTAM: zinc transport system ATP-binding protein [Acetivibrio alkalicellulosi]
MDNIIEVLDVGFAYNGNQILNKISFNIPKGTFTGVIGPNGSGKSTLVKLLLDILSPNEGKIKIMGMDVKKFKEWNKIGYISQKVNTFNGAFPATVEEIVRANLYSKIGLFKRPRKFHKSLVDEALDKVGMLPYKKNLIGKLSGGQQQRVFIARVLVSEPEILILDEPTVGIDAKSEEAVYCLLARLNKELGITIMMVTHDIGAVTVHADRLLCLGDKGLMIHNTDSNLSREQVSEIYGYHINLHSHACDKCKWKAGGTC